MQYHLPRMFTKQHGAVVVPSTLALDRSTTEIVD
jgi:hypothetical protein